MGGSARAGDHPSPRLLRSRLFALLVTSVVVAITFDRALSERLDVTVGGALAGTAAVCLGLLLGARLLGALSRSQTDLQRRYREVLADALRDQLTDLGNHRAFQEELDRQVEHALRYRTSLALVLLDLDDFKSINDTFGHAAGDRALVQLGRLISSATRRTDSAYRVGGDEFAIVLPQTDAAGARIVSSRLLATALQPPGLTQDRGGLDGPSGLSFSAGVSAIPELAEGRAQLYAQADAALYAANRNGRTAVEIFGAAELDGGPADRSAAVAEVIGRGLMRPAYQPIVDLTAGRVVGYEGLTRLVESAPFADPGSLFAAAETTGRLVALDLACAEMIVAGAGSLADDLFLSINLSPRTVESPDFTAGSLLGVLARHRFPPHRVVLELTEHEPVNDPLRLRVKLDACRSAGIRLAADDVGAGNAGLRLLSQLRFDFIKVDVSLVHDAAAGTMSREVMGSVIDLARRTGATIVAEGIEEPWQRAQLIELAVPLGQGYLLGRPGALASEPMRATAGVAASGVTAWRETIGLPTAAGNS
jgi:diguanylate cyclase (GGDEF)-like protein